MRAIRGSPRLIAIMAACTAVALLEGAVQPVRAKRSLVISANEIASHIGSDALRDGGNAIDAAVAAAFALAVVHPTGGNIGGGGFLVYRSGAGETAAYDFRETAPSRSSPTMFLQDRRYDSATHHRGYRAVGVPGTVAGLHLAWKEHGRLPWKRLIEPAVALARDGLVVSIGLARSLARTLDDMKPYPASLAQFSKQGRPYEPGDRLRQPDLARTLERIAARGPSDFYEGETASLIASAMQANGGLITREDLKAYQAKKRMPLGGMYRGYDIVTVPPPSSGGVGLVEMLNILEGYDLGANGYGSAQNVHLIVEAMRRAFADRARHLGDGDFNGSMPVDRLISKEYARELRTTIDPRRSSTSTPTSFSWPAVGSDTTHISIVDDRHNAVALTYTLEDAYGSRIVVPGAGFLLNNEMGDFNAGPGLTTSEGLIGTEANLAQPGKRMLSNMTPTIVSKDGKLFMVTGTPGGRTIINTVLLTILNVIDFGMNAQEAVDAGRFHHQWLPDRVTYERFALSSDTIELLKGAGYTLQEGGAQGAAEVIVYDAANDVLEGGVDRRQADSGAAVR